MTKAKDGPRAARVDGWTKARREQFLDHLAATAHVGEAAEAVGMTTTGAYMLRRRDAAFAEQWRAAILCGYDRIEAALIRKALGMSHAPVVDSAATGTEPGPGEIDVNIATHLLARHRATVQNTGRKVAATALRATRDATAATLLRKLEAVEKRIRARDGA